MKAGTRWTRDQLRAKGFVPDRGGIVRLPESEWRERQLPPHALPPADCRDPEEAGYPAKPAIRVPRQRHPNATEHRWFLSAKSRWPGLEIRYEAISFRLAAGPLYTPDFSGWDGARLVWVAEVKGSYKLGSQSRSVLAWKSAAAEWPAVTFIFAQRKNGEWAETAIGPASYCA